MESASRFQGTYWGGSGMHQVQAERMSELLNPFLLEGKKPETGSLLDLYEKTQAVYYDLYNSGMANGHLSLPPLADLLNRLKDAAPALGFKLPVRESINAVLGFHDQFMEAEALGDQTDVDLNTLEWPDNEAIKGSLEVLLNFVFELARRDINPRSRYALDAYLTSSK